MCHALLWGERGLAQGPSCFANVDNSMLNIVHLGENWTKQSAMLYRSHSKIETNDQQVSNDFHDPNRTFAGKN